MNHLTETCHGAVAMGTAVEKSQRSLHGSWNLLVSGALNNVLKTALAAFEDQ